MVITGVIRPPPEIRAVADRTALYVAKNGRAFEARILKSAKGKTPKFAFLHETSPFHAYYEDKIQFYENGGEDGKEEGGDENNGDGTNGKLETTNKNKVKSSSQADNNNSAAVVARKTETTQKASAIDPIAKALLAERNRIQQARVKQKEETKEDEEENSNEKHRFPLPPPPALEMVSIVAPSNLTAVQIETIQLVAQFSAMDGKGGPFLRHLTMREWSNSAFSFCQPRHPHFAYFSALVDAYRKIMGQWIGAATNKSEEELPALDSQTFLQQAAYRAEYEREMQQIKSEQEEGEIVAIDWQDFVVVETIDFPVDEKVELGMLPPPPPPPTTQALQPAAAAATGDGMEESSDDEEEETIRVVPSYTPKVVGAADLNTARAIDPITGKSVPVADIPEHLRIQLLDPKWAEERKKFQEKQKDSNLVSGDAIASNISRFAQARGDLFGKSEQELLTNEKDSKRRLEEANRIIREQAAQSNQPAAVGPSLPGASGGDEPASKRQRTDNAQAAPPPRTLPPDAKVTRAVAPPPMNEPTSQTSSGVEHDPMASAMLPQAQPPVADTEEKILLPEAEFAASLSKPEVTLQIRVPNDPTQMAWNFYGQILSMTVNVMSTVKSVKEELAKAHLNGMPANKIQFKDPGSGFLKDKASLAALNIGPTATVDMVLKTRGGRK